MICPDCLEEYHFIRFNVDPDTMEHRGEFSCECMDSIVFPEFVVREILDDEDLQDQLRLSRLFHFRRSVAEEPPAQPARPGVLRVNTRHLERYLQTFSEQSLRQLK